MSKSETDSGILSAAEMQLEEWSKSQIIKWVIAKLTTITDSKKPYDKDEDYDEDEDGGYMWDDDDDECEDDEDENKK